MAFNPPTFNLVANLWHAPAVPPAAPTLTDVPCQLFFPKPTANDQIPDSATGWTIPRYLRFPAGTDVRFLPSGSSVITIAEVPAGSGRRYKVIDVDDAHKGFPNEYRVAVVKPTGSWPFPIP